MYVPNNWNDIIEYATSAQRKLERRTVWNPRQPYRAQQWHEVAIRSSCVGDLGPALGLDLALHRLEVLLNAVYSNGERTVLLAHLLGDFPLQSSSMVQGKRHGVRAYAVFPHSTVMPVIPFLWSIEVVGGRGRQRTRS